MLKQIKRQLKLTVFIMFTFQKKKKLFIKYYNIIQNISVKLFKTHRQSLSIVYRPIKKKKLLLFT